jgi:hypothetical protein
LRVTLLNLQQQACKLGMKTFWPWKNVNCLQKTTR